MNMTTHYNAALNEAESRLHFVCGTNAEWELRINLMRRSIHKQLGVATGTKLTIKDAGNRVRITHYRP